MADDFSPALRDATHVKEIGFADFTTDLVLKVFNGLVAANVNQMEAYLQLVQEVGKSLKDYVNETHDQIGADQILAFLSAALPKSETTGEPKQIAEGTKVEEADVKALNQALELPGESGGIATTSVSNNQAAPAAGTTLTADHVKTILEAVARRIAANKYDLLREMVKQGLLRLVVVEGDIQAKLTFNTYSSTFYSKNTSSYSRSQFDFAAKAKTGSALSRWVSASASANYSTVTVQTANENQFASTSTSVNIYGLVNLKFKTDFLPLST